MKRSFNWPRVRFSKRTATRLVVIYAAFGIAWVLLTDVVLVYLVRDLDTLARLQTAKGWFFVAISALFIYWLADRSIGRGQRTEILLQRNQAMLARAEHLARLGSFVWDIARDIVRWSDELYRIYGLTPDEFGGTYQAYLAQVHPQDRQQSEQAIQAALEGEDVVVFEERIVCPDGSVRTLLSHVSAIRDEDGRPVQVYGACQDITEQKQAMATLHRRNQELELFNRASRAFNSSLDLAEVLESVLGEVRRVLGVVACSIWLLDSETGELVCREVTNPAREIIRGWRLQPGQGIAGWVLQNGRSMVTPNAREDERHYSAIDEQTGLDIRSILAAPLVIKGEPIGVIQLVDTAEDRFGRADLTLIQSLAAVAATAIENARLYNRLQQHTTELAVKVEERTQQLREANEQLRVLDRLKSKFISDISHELRTPISNILLYLDLRERGAPERQERYMAILKREGSRLKQLVEGILDLSRLDMGREQGVEMVPVDLNEVVEGVIQAHLPYAEVAGLTLTFTPETTAGQVWGEASQLTQVVTNLVINAIHYTPAGEVEVSTFADKANERVCLRVADTGTGIAAEELPYIFDRFYRGQQVGQFDIPGSGLGLAIVKEIVDIHHGSIGVQSREGEGSVFTVCLPVNSG